MESIKKQAVVITWLGKQIYTITKEKMSVVDSFRSGGIFFLYFFWSYIVFVSIVYMYLEQENIRRKLQNNLKF